MSTEMTTDEAPAAVEAPSPQIEEVPPMLMEAPPMEPLRPLAPGAFLRSEFEVKEIISRGSTNLYAAQSDDYVNPVQKLIAERAEPLTAPPASAPLASESPVSEPPAATPLPAEEVAPQEESTPVAEQVPAAMAEDTSAPLQSSLFPAHERFTQDEREYLVFDFENTTALQDHRESTNDARYLRVLDALTRGLQELEEKGLHADLTRELLRFDGGGALRYYGFTEPHPAADAVIHEAVPGPVEQLSEINNFLLKQVFGEAATMRLDDEFSSLAFSEEVKALARRLNNGEYSTVAEVAAALAQLYHPERALRLETALLGDVGQQREINEDSGLIWRLHRVGHSSFYDFDLFVVADGMGGHEGGEIASDLTIESLQRALTQRAESEAINWNDNVAVRQALLGIIEEVNNEVVALTETQRYRSLRAKPGSTLTLALRLGSRVFVGNVGDSRAYKWNAASGLQRISKDHSYVQNLIDSGQLTEEESWDHPDGSVITAHIGYAKLKTIDVFLRLFAPGDKLLLVSDGVVDMLRDREIEPYLHENDPAV
ncbi:MAG TPA: protein phosphatase 2C domain-containing protein, partial [Abditibacteriaceae bacterium]|nr:protein phosphatase 2C domain-containing protein [Abditibacteriaceae bacterium]